MVLPKLLGSLVRISLDKGQIKRKADCRAIDSPKKQTIDFFLFFFAIHGKQNKFVHSFLGESTARPNCFLFYLTFSGRIKKYV